MDITIHANVRMADERYEGLVNQLRDPDLADRMWRDAEHKLVEDPSKRWFFASVHGEIRAWVAGEIIWPDDDCGRKTEAIVAVTDGFERPGLGRQYRLYPMVFHALMAHLVRPSELPAEAYVFRQPRPLMEHYGWTWTGGQGDGELPGHHWYHMRYQP